jgi:hypothetical protein
MTSELISYSREDKELADQSAAPWPKLVSKRQ